jgi:hypothetical protein
MKANKAVFTVEFYEPQDVESSVPALNQDALNELYMALEYLQNHKIIKDYYCSEFVEE